MSPRGWLLFVALSLIWGVPYLLIKIIVAELPVAVLVFARVGIAALVLLPFAMRDLPVTLLLRHWRPLLAFATLEFALPWGLLSHAETRIHSSTAGLLMATIPVLAVIVGRLTGDKEAISSRRWCGLALGFFGVFLLAGLQWGDELVPTFEVLGAAAAYATAAVVAGRGLRSVPALPMMTVCLAAAALMYLPAAVLAWPSALPSGRVIASLGVLAVVCTSLAFIWFFGLIREVGISRAVVFTYINPVVAMVAGALLLSEPLSLTTLLAFAFILAGSLLATARGEPAQPASTAETSSP